MKKIFVVCGTRPEAIKLAPLIKQLIDHPDVDVSLCATGQHREMLDQVFALFDLKPDYDLDVMKSSQGLTDVTCAVLAGLEPILKNVQPDYVVVHGDTNTTMSTSLAAYYAQIPVAHVEAGLRTGNILSPWPEEGNRRLAAVLATRHYAPTLQAQQNLLSENIEQHSIIVTGNTVIDALLEIVSRLDSDEQLRSDVATSLPTLNRNKKLILVTGHRRENFGSGFESFFGALKTLSMRDDVELVFPVHLNPQVREPVFRILGESTNIHLIEPLTYLPFVYLMNMAHFIISDSGGIQEEAPALGAPVLVTRTNTERPEAIEAGTVKLVGTDSETILAEASKLLDDPAIHMQMSQAKNPFGDGTACSRIVRDLTS